jgi:hypothetical protein
MEVSDELHTLEKKSEYPVSRRLCGVQSHSEHNGEGKNVLLLGIIL